MSRNFQLLVVKDNQSSTGLGSGALQVVGGIYAGGTSSYFSGNVNIAANNSFSTGYASYLTLAYTGAASATTGAIVSAGGAYFGNDSVVNGTLTVTGAASAIVLLGTENATSATQGAFLCSGGINVAKNAIVIGEMGTYTYLGGSYLVTLSIAAGAALTFSGGITTKLATGALNLGYLGGSRYQGYITTPTMVTSNVNFYTFAATFPMTFAQLACPSSSAWTGVAGNVIGVISAFTDASSNGVVLRFNKSSGTAMTGSRYILGFNLLI